MSNAKQMLCRVPENVMDVGKGINSFFCGHFVLASCATKIKVYRANQREKVQKKTNFSQIAVRNLKQEIKAN